MKAPLVFNALWGIILSLSLSCSETNWALADLNFIKEAIQENHPGMYDEHNPSFCTLLKDNFDKARTLLAKIVDENEQKQALHNFGKSFNDAHLRVVFFRNTAQTQINTPQKMRAFSFDTTEHDCFIKLPTFAPNQEEKSILESIIYDIPTIKNKPLIVFDLRGNCGGSSAWGSRIANALFGKEYAQHKKNLALSNQYTQWRASKSNIEYLNNELINYITETYGEQSTEAQGLSKFIENIQSAYNEGLLLYQEEKALLPLTTGTFPESECSSTIVAIVDKYCVSACLDFIDELKLMGTKVILIGQQTNADSVYMECREIPLPSKKGLLALPIKVYRNRPRGHNIAYTPDVFYEDIENTDMLYQYIKHNL